MKAAASMFLLVACLLLSWTTSTSVEAEADPVPVPKHLQLRKRLLFDRVRGGDKKDCPEVELGGHSALDCREKFPHGPAVKCGDCFYPSTCEAALVFSRVDTNCQPVEEEASAETLVQSLVKLAEDTSASVHAHDEARARDEARVTQSNDQSKNNDDRIFRTNYRLSVVDSNSDNDDSHHELKEEQERHLQDTIYYSFLVEETNGENPCGGYRPPYRNGVERACCDCEIEFYQNTPTPISKCVGLNVLRTDTTSVRGFCSDVCGPNQTTTEWCDDPPYSREYGYCNSYEYEDAYTGYDDCCGANGDRACCTDCPEVRTPGALDYCGGTRCQHDRNPAYSDVTTAHGGAYECTGWMESSFLGAIEYFNNFSGNIPVCLDIETTPPTFCGGTGQRACCPCEIERFDVVTARCNDPTNIPIDGLLLSLIAETRPDEGFCHCLTDEKTTAVCDKPEARDIICGNLGQRACCDCEIEDTTFFDYLTSPCQFDPFSIPVPNTTHHTCYCLDPVDAITGTFLECQRILQCGEEDGDRACCECESDIYNVPSCAEGLVPKKTNHYNTCLGCTPVYSNLVCVNQTAADAKPPPPAPLDPADAKCLIGCADCDYGEQCALNHNNMLVVSKAAKLADMVYNLPSNWTNDPDYGEYLDSIFEDGRKTVLVDTDDADSRLDGFCFFAFRNTIFGEASQASTELSFVDLDNLLNNIDLRPVEICSEHERDESPTSCCLMPKGPSETFFDASYIDDILPLMYQCVEAGKQLVFSGFDGGGAAAKTAAVAFSHYNPWTITFGMSNILWCGLPDCPTCPLHLLDKQSIDFVNTQPLDKTLLTDEKIFYDPWPYIWNFYFYVLTAKTIGFILPGLVHGDTPFCLLPPTTGLEFQPAIACYQAAYVLPKPPFTQILDAFVHNMTAYRAKIEDIYANLDTESSGPRTDGFHENVLCTFDSECSGDCTSDGCTAPTPAPPPRDCSAFGEHPFGNSNRNLLNEIDFSVEPDPLYTEVSCECLPDCITDWRCPTKDGSVFQLSTPKCRGQEQEMYAIMMPKYVGETVSEEGVKGTFIVQLVEVDPSTNEVLKNITVQNRSPFTKDLFVVRECVSRDSCTKVKVIPTQLTVPYKLDGVVSGQRSFDSLQSGNPQKTGPTTFEKELGNCVTGGSRRILSQAHNREDLPELRTRPHNHHQLSEGFQARLRHASALGGNGTGPPKRPQRELLPEIPFPDDCGGINERACCPCEIELFDELEECDGPGLVATQTNFYQSCTSCFPFLTGFVCHAVGSDPYGEGDPPPPRGPDDYECLSNCAACDYPEQCLLSYDKTLVVAEAARLSKIVYPEFLPPHDRDRLFQENDQEWRPGIKKDTFVDATTNETKTVYYEYYTTGAVIDFQEAMLVSSNRTDNYCYFAFRGAEEFDISSIDPRPVSVCSEHDHSNCCPLSKGFTDTYAQATLWYFAKFPAVDGSKSFRQHLYQCVEDGKVIVFTGHSKGGAAAKAAGVAFSHYNPYTISFAAPDILWCTDFECPTCPLHDQGKRTIDFINTDARNDGTVNYDPVPYLTTLVNYYDYFMTDVAGLVNPDFDLNPIEFPNPVKGDHPHCLLPPRVVENQTTALKCYDSPDTRRKPVRHALTALPTVPLLRLSNREVHRVVHYMNKLEGLVQNLNDALPSSVGSGPRTDGWEHESACTFRSECQGRICYQSSGCNEPTPTAPPRNCTNLAEAPLMPTEVPTGSDQPSQSPSQLPCESPSNMPADAPSKKILCKSLLCRVVFSSKCRKRPLCRLLNCCPSRPTTTCTEIDSVSDSVRGGRFLTEDSLPVEETSSNGLGGAMNELQVDSETSVNEDGFEEGGRRLFESIEYSITPDPYFSNVTCECFPNCTSRFRCPLIEDSPVAVFRECDKRVEFEFYGFLMATFPATFPGNGTTKMSVELLEYDMGTDTSTLAPFGELTNLLPIRNDLFVFSTCLQLDSCYKLDIVPVNKTQPYGFWYWMGNITANWWAARNVDTAPIQGVYNVRVPDKFGRCI